MAAHTRPTRGRSQSPSSVPFASPFGGLEAEAGVDFDSDPATGLVVFRAGHEPGDGMAVTAGFLFDVPARFDTDFLEVDLAAFAAGEIPSIPVIEIRP